MGPQLIQKRVDLDKLISWLWDLFNNDPALLKNEEAMEQGAQMEQAQQMINMGGPVAGMLKDGGQAAQALSQAGATAGEGGMDIGAMIQAFQQNVSQDPEAQAELAQLVEGQMPESMAALGEGMPDPEALLPEDEPVV